MSVIDKMNLKRKFRTINNIIVSFGKTKIFCIGLNKTGTTSVSESFENLGFVVGVQRTAEYFINDWAKRDFRRIIRYCHTAQAFQDVPFSLPFTYIFMDQAFQNSKFILTVRNDAEQWYNSLTNFHAKLWGKGNIPNKKILQSAKYIYKGRPWEANQLVFNTPENDPYNKKILINYYENHNKNVLEYFRHRERDLIVLNLAENNAYQKLCKFLNITDKADDFPWKNKTSEI